MDKEIVNEISVVPAKWDIEISTSKSDFKFTGSEEEVKAGLRELFDWKVETDFIEVIIVVSCSGHNKRFNMKIIEQSKSITIITFEKATLNSVALEGVLQQNALEFLIQ